MKKTVFTLLTILSSFILVEIICRMALSSDYVINLLIKDLYDRPTDHLNRIHFVKRVYKHDNHAYYSFDQHHPLLGWVLKPNLKNFKMRNGAILTSNSSGIRDSREFTLDKNKHRIAILGDSFTFGEEVGNNETYSYYLQQLTPNSEVMNFGIHGYGHDQMLLYYNEKVKHFSPDIVIVSYLELDEIRNAMQFRDYAKPMFDLTADGIRLQKGQIPIPEELYVQELYKLKLPVLWEIFYDFFMSDAVNQINHNRTSEILKKLVLDIKQNGSMPLFIYLPMTTTHNPDGIRLEGNSSPIKTFCRVNNVPFIDLSIPLTRRLHEIKLIQDDFLKVNHWPPMMHKIIAEEIKNSTIFSSELAK